MLTEKSFQYDRTPLHYASDNGHIVEVLLSHGATVDMKDRVSIVWTGIAYRTYTTTSNVQ